MARIDRMIQRARIAAPSAFDTSQHFVEEAMRSRTARRVRLHVRRMEPVAVRTPRWSEPASFLEDLALDLAVGEPGVGCRTVNLRPLKGRRASESWQFTLHVFAQLGRREWRHRPPAMVADRGGFRFALTQLIEEAHHSAPHPVALLAHGVEFAPMEVIEDLARVWGEYARRHPSGRRATLLLAGTAEQSWWPLADAPQVDLVDFGAAEAAAAIVGQMGDTPISMLQRAAHFSGGVPGIVGAVGNRLRMEAMLPDQDDALLASLGSVADEIRGAVDIVHMDSGLADRLYDLVAGEPVTRVPEVDDALVMAGLIRTVKGHGEDKVQLRAPAIATLLR
jgi:hypothetical protein